jgi:hypothetical protein
LVRRFGAYTAMPSTSAASRACFVTGADAGYFWLASAAIQSLDEQCPGADVRVLDFGVTPAQADFLRSRHLLLERPAEVPAGLHPYELKTCFGRYVRALPHENIVWLDGDVLCVGDAAAAVNALFRQMERKGSQVAACPDMGPNPTLGRFASSFPAPALASFIGSAPGRGGLRYLNTGVIAFRGARGFFAQWERMAARMPGETCIDQNAFNILVHGNPDAALVLDPAVWNVHSSLLGRARLDGTGCRCEGSATRAVFLHGTSYRLEFVDEYPVQLRVAGLEIDTVVKSFRDTTMRRHHLELLKRFVKTHAAALKDCGVAS